MTTILPTTPESKSPSRRALLAGALGGLGALAAGAIGRVNPVRAGTDGDVVLGTGNAATTTTSITNSTNDNDVLSGISTGLGNGVSGSSHSNSGVRGTSYSFPGVYGASTLSNGVYGTSTSEQGVSGFSSSSNGVYGVSDSTSQAATVGKSNGNWTGVQGHSGTSLVQAARAKTGVFGYAAQDNFSRGVIGESPAGIGVYGITSTGYGGYFAGKVYTTKWYELSEISTPASPYSHRARLFAKDNGVGKTQLCVKFGNGTVKILATEG
jgi:hypothetical protein